MNEDYYFLEHELSKEVFAQTDFWLKSGYHIQHAHPEQEEHCRYLDDKGVFMSLKAFYSKFYGVELSSGGDRMTKSNYYFIEFRPQSGNRLNRGSFSLFDIERLDAEMIIMGLLLAFMNSIEVIYSISQVQQLLEEDYDEFKEGIYRLLAKNKSGKMHLYKDQPEISRIIEGTLKKFGLVKWLYFPSEHGDEFTIMPSFERFTKVLYEKEIREFNNLFKIDSK